MNLPPDCEFHDDIRLFIHRPRGLLNEAVVNRLISALSDLEAREKEPFNRFADSLEADAVALNFRYILHVSLHRRLTYMGRAPIKSALLATDSTIIHYGKLHKMMTQGSPIDFRIFQDRQEVANWLNVPIERLTAKVSNESK